MGRRKWLLPCSVGLSAVNGLLSLVPFILLWLVVRILLTAEGDLADTSLWDYALAAFVVSVANILLYFFALMLSHLAAFRIEINMRRWAMERLMRAPLGFFDTQNTGRMRKIIDEDSGQTHTFVAHILPDVAGSVVAPLGVIILLFMVDWQMGLASMVPLVCAFGIMGYMMNPKNNHFQRMYLDALEKMSAEAVEYVRGIPVVKVFQQTVFSFKRFYDSIINYRNLVIKYTLLWRTPMSAYIVAINAFAFFLVPTGILLIGHGGQTAVVISDMTLYVLIAPVISVNVMKAMHLSQNLFLANEAVDRLEKLTDATPLPDSETPQRAKSSDICLHNVSFRYDGAEKDAVSHINLTIGEGKTVALVGPSGSGKTTIARLIPRFWDVREGSVSIGGTDVRQMDKAELMHSVSFVFQNTRLFKTSILENVRYGTPEATLDEATAFADPENEHLIREALAHLTHGKTVLMIAHRLTTVQDADSIVVVANGRIAEQGTHEELMARKSMYNRMWNEYQQSVAWKL